MRHRHSLEALELNLRTKKQTTLQIVSCLQRAGGMEWQSQAAAHSYADFDQLRRAATPHTITGPKLPYGAPFGPVMYPSLAIFRMRNSSVRRPRYPFLMASSVHS